MGQKRLQFDTGFKLPVVQMIKDQGPSIGQACRDMNLRQTAVCRWLKQMDANQSGQPCIGKPLPPNSKASVRWKPKFGNYAGHRYLK